MSADFDVRRAVEDDLPDLLEIADHRRQEYERYQPTFWRPACDAVARQRDYFSSLLADDQVGVYVAATDASIRGFVIARTVDAPPVYDPGGSTCVVDDFAVRDPADWTTVGPALLAAVRSWAATRGAVQLVVVTAHLDAPKRAALGRAQLAPASEWWVGPVDTPRPGP